MRRKVHRFHKRADELSPSDDYGGGPFHCPTVVLIQQKDLSLESITGLPIDWVGLDGFVASHNHQSRLAQRSIHIGSAVISSVTPPNGTLFAIQLFEEAQA